MAGNLTQEIAHFLQYHRLLTSARWSVDDVHDVGLEVLVARRRRVDAVLDAFHGFLLDLR